MLRLNLEHVRISLAKHSPNTALRSCRQLANRRVFAMAAVGAPDGIKARRCTRAGQAHRVMRLLLARSSLCMLRCHMRSSPAIKRVCDHQCGRSGHL